MTADEAAALARQISKVLKDSGAPFLLAIEYDVDEAHTRSVWHVGGNSTDMANMAGAVLSGVVAFSQPSDCEACNAALAAMERARDSLTPGGAARTCH